MTSPTRRCSTILVLAALVWGAAQAAVIHVPGDHATIGGALAGTGLPPRSLGEINGIFKAYCTRVGNGPFPTELLGTEGDELREAGGEYGATTGRPRRCGWLDLPGLRYAARVNGVDGWALTKLDVLDELETIRICVGYTIDGEETNGLPIIVDRFADCQPVYEELPGWQASTVGITRYEKLPANARDYLQRIEELAGIPVDIISTGPDREQTIVKRHPFE